MDQINVITNACLINKNNAVSLLIEFTFHLFIKNKKQAEIALIWGQIDKWFSLIITHNDCALRTVFIFLFLAAKFLSISESSQCVLVLLMTSNPAPPSPIYVAMCLRYRDQHQSHLKIDGGGREGVLKHGNDIIGTRLVSYFVLVVLIRQSRIETVQSQEIIKVIFFYESAKFIFNTTVLSLIINILFI